MFIDKTYQIKILKNVFYLVATLLSVNSYSNNFPLTNDDIYRVEHPEGMQIMSCSDVMDASAPKLAVLCQA